jgi:hypothetical protein
MTADLQVSTCSCEHAWALRQGKHRAVVLAVSIICEAIDRYKELCEGAFCGAAVLQHVGGIVWVS